MSDEDPDLQTLSFVREDCIDKGNDKGNISSRRKILWISPVELLTLIAHD